MHDTSAHSVESLLTRLAAESTLPPAPDLAAKAISRLDMPPGNRHGGRSRVLRLAAVVVLLLAGAATALSVSGRAREAVAEFLGLAVPGERIELTREEPVDGVVLLPSVTAAVEETTLDEARAALDFDPALPAADVERVYLLTFAGLEGVVLRTERFDVWQFRNDGDVFLGKSGYDGTTSVERVTLDGRDAYWVIGGPRVLTVHSSSGELITGIGVTADAHVLLFADGPITYRIEGELTREEALAVAAELLD